MTDSVSAMPSARAFVPSGSSPAARVSPLRASIGYRVERHTAIATADLMAPKFWTATDGAATGYGDTRKAAIAHLERLTAWRRAA